MDETARTVAAYEGDAEAFVAKYRRGSVAAEQGERFVESLSGDRVLDVGCGPGSDAAAFAERDLDVTGLDPTLPFLRSARDHVPAASFVRGDMRRLPFPTDSFDGVWACASLLHLPRADAPAALDEFRRVLAADGVCCCILKRGDESGYDQDGRYFERYQPDAVRSLARDAGFDVVDLSAWDRWIHLLATAP